MVAVVDYVYFKRCFKLHSVDWLCPLNVYALAIIVHFVMLGKEVMSYISNWLGLNLFTY